MCTVVCRCDALRVRLLALRDELASRSFDEPGYWWPDYPGLLGGRDQQAGGTWCASDVAAGVTAVVLNSPAKRVADAGAPSRGVLPLLAASHRGRWTAELDVAGMASFTLVLAEPGSLQCWTFDGEALRHHPLGDTAYVFTPVAFRTAAEDARFTDEPIQWRAVVDGTQASDDPLGLVVRLPVDDQTYETVFGQVIAAQPGQLNLDFRRNPAREPDRAWTSVTYSA